MNKTMRTQVFMLMCCVEVSLGRYVVIGVGRVIAQRHHADITITEFSLLYF